MSEEVIEEICKYLEKLQLVRSVNIIRQEITRLNKENISKQKDEEVKKMILNSIKNKDKLSQKSQKSHPLTTLNANQINENSFNKKETEEVMENLMNRIAHKHNLIADDNLNAKIENIFNVPLFQKMVENAGIYENLSESHTQSISLNQSDALKKGGEKTQNLFDHLKQTHEGEIEEEDVPRFGGGAKSTNPFQNIKKNQNIKETPKSKATLEKCPSVGEIVQTPEIGNEKVEKRGEGFADEGSFHELKAYSPKNDEETANKIEKYFNAPGKNMPSIIQAEPEDPNDSSVLPDSYSSLFPTTDPTVDEYNDDDDPGFEIYEAHEMHFEESCKELAEKFGFPARSIKPQTKSERKRELEEKEKENLKNKNNKLEEDLDDSAIILKHMQENKEKKDENASTPKAKDEEPRKPIVVDTPKDKEEDAGIPKDKKGSYDRKQKERKDSAVSESSRKYGKAIIEETEDKVVSLLPEHVKFMSSGDHFYPVEFQGVIYDSFNMRVVFDREKTGFEETKDFPIVIDSIIAGRYQVVEYLGSAAFSKAIQCMDFYTGEMVCMKIIENNKDYFDQSVDEIKLLRYININGNVDENNVLKLYDFFYHKEHLFIVTELLRDNLYEFSKYNRENEDYPYFTIGRLQKITKQVLNALDFIHSLNLIHCDLKPENILIKSYSRCEVKVIDFGSSCFIHDHLSSYVQSRSYRAPEVILGCKYDYKIDMWSLGCILSELFTGYVLFQNDSVQGLLARVIGILSPIPERMMRTGKLVSNFFTREGLIYQEPGDDDYSQTMSESSMRHVKKRNLDQTMRIQILIPKRTTLKHRFKTDDQNFIDFIRWLLEIDPLKRPTAKEAMNHPWLTQSQYPDGL